MAWWAGRWALRNVADDIAWARNDPIGTYLGQWSPPYGRFGSLHQQRAALRAIRSQLMEERYFFESNKRFTAGGIADEIRARLAREEQLGATG
jgi:hypothetical protein